MTGRNFDEATGGQYDYSGHDSGDEHVEKAEQSAFVPPVPTRIEARMQCYSVQPGSVDGSGGVSSEIWEFTAVYSNDPENVNSQWSKWTPSANLKMYVSNDVAFGKIAPGKQYRVLLIEEI